MRRILASRPGARKARAVFAGFGKVAESNEAAAGGRRKGGGRATGWGGRHVHFGDGVYANFNLTCVDDADIFVGSHTMIGPNVTICTASHPLSPALREKGLQYNRPVRIGANVWIGASVTILPGVTIGDRLNDGRYDIRYFETRLTAAALPLADGSDAVCAFVNAEIDRAVVEGLVARGIRVLAMRCAGYNNVDFRAAYEKGLAVVRVPAYSPYAVAEHAAALLLALDRHIHRAAARTRDFNFTLANLDAYFSGAPLENEICYRCTGTERPAGAACPRRVAGRCHSAAK